MTRLIASIVFVMLTGLLCLETAFARALRLKDVIGSAEKHFPKILIAKQSIAIANLNVINAEAAFDDRLENLSLSTPQGGYENFYNRTLLTMPIQNYGANVFVKYRNGHGNWPIYDKNFLTNNLGEASIALDLPLLRNSAIDADRALIKLSKLDVQEKKIQLVKQKNIILYQAGLAYWYWVAQVNSLSFSKKLLELSKVRQRALRKKTHLGDSADIELIENKRFILQRQANVIQNEVEVLKASRRLSLYYRGKNGKPLTPKPERAPNDLKLPMTPSRMSMSKIIDINPDLRTLMNGVEKQNAKIAQAENLLKPILNLNLSLKKQYGDGGDPLLKDTAYNVGLNFVVPLGFRKATTEYHANKIIRSQLMTDYQLKAQTLDVDVKNIHNDMAASKRQIDLLDKEVKLAYKIEDAERIKFKEGDSSLFLLNQREQTSFSLELSLLSSLISYQSLKLRLISLCNFDAKCF